MPIIDLTQQVTSRLPIQPVKLETGKWKHEGLNAVTLLSVELTEQTDDKGEFMGIPRKVLNITFTNFRQPNSTEPERFTTLSEKAIGTKMNQGGTLVLRPEADIITNNNDMFKRIKHILDGCKSSPTYRDISAIADKKILEKYFDLPGFVTAGTPEEAAKLRSEKYDAFLQFIYDWFNGSDKFKAIHLDANSKPIIHGWLKVLPAYPNKVYYAIPTWVQQGFFEAAGIDSKSGFLTPARIVSVKVTESLELVSKDAAAKVSAMPGAIPGVGDAMLEYLKQQGANG